LSTKLCFSGKPIKVFIHFTIIIPQNYNFATRKTSAPQLIIHPLDYKEKKMSCIQTVFRFHFLEKSRLAKKIYKKLSPHYQKLITGKKKFILKPNNLQAL